MGRYLRRTGIGIYRTEHISSDTGSASSGSAADTGTASIGVVRQAKKSVAVLSHPFWKGTGIRRQTPEEPEGTVSNLNISP
jgi:hypothetical protein